jgi:c-di-AMP phosphodiesterase-like protein
MVDKGEIMMDRKRMPYILAGLVTLIAVLMLPIIIQVFFAKNVSVWKRLMIIAMPVFIGIMWYNARKNVQNNNEHHLNDSANK